MRTNVTAASTAVVPAIAVPGKVDVAISMNDAESSSTLATSSVFAAASATS